MSGGAISQDSKPLGGAEWGESIAPFEMCSVWSRCNRVIGVHAGGGGWDGRTPQPRVEGISRGRAKNRLVGAWHTPPHRLWAPEVDTFISKRCSRREGKASWRNGQADRLGSD